jgi:hypothetical protein
MKKDLFKTRKSAPRLERSSFLLLRYRSLSTDYFTWFAMTKKAGVEGGNWRPNKKIIYERASVFWLLLWLLHHQLFFARL